MKLKSVIIALLVCIGADAIASSNTPPALLCPSRTSNVQVPGTDRDWYEIVKQYKAAHPKQFDLEVYRKKLEDQYQGTEWFAYEGVNFYHINIAIEIDVLTALAAKYEKEHNAEMVQAINERLALDKEWLEKGCPG